MSQPLADRMRPTTFEQVIGQAQITAEDSPVRRALAADQLSSLILYGPPGTGKTTLALIIASSLNANFIQLSAVTSGIKDLREVIKQAEQAQEQGQRTVLFVDEIHRWNKAQQDALLPHVEKGTVILLGATTENPGHEVNSALNSRVIIVPIKLLDEQQLKLLLNRALTEPIGLGEEGVQLSEQAEQVLIRHADGDARRLLNGLETIAAQRTGEVISGEQASQALGRRHIRYDKGGDNHYDTISAFIKSIRGSDPDAALYYLARMEAGGEDPKFVARRLVILASEDIGMARPGALAVANSVFDAVLRIGAPECWINLAHGSVYLALCPKSWASYQGWRRAQKIVQQGPTPPIPSHLQSHNYVTKQFKEGEYQHASEQDAPSGPGQFLPQPLQNKRIYRSDVKKTSP